VGLGAAGTASATPSYPASAAGDWTGTLGSGGAARHIFVHIHKTLAGAYLGTMDSPDSASREVALSPMSMTDGSLAFAAGDATFRGQWDPMHGQWTGTWTEAGQTWPVSLKQDVDNATSRRLR
jgi:hypothetical protein